jgi:hypothetical protein
MWTFLHVTDTFSFEYVFKFNFLKSLTMCIHICSVCTDQGNIMEMHTRLEAGGGVIYNTGGGVFLYLHKLYYLSYYQKCFLSKNILRFFSF